MHNPAASSHGPAYRPIPGVKGALRRAAITPQPALDPRPRAASTFTQHYPLEIQKRHKLEDIKGLKIRTILNPLYVDMFNTLGANAVPMPFPELYTAMEMKTVDGQENPETTVDASKFYEVQKYFSGTRHIYNPQMMMVSKKFWDSLSADEKKIFEEAAVEARDVQRKAARAMTEKSRKVMTDHGMQLNEIDPAELARMKEAVKPVVDKYAAQLDPALVKAFNAELDRVKNLK